MVQGKSGVKTHPGRKRQTLVKLNYIQAFIVRGDRAQGEKMMIHSKLPKYEAGQKL